MSDRLFTPTYKVEGFNNVSYSKNGDMSVEPSGYAGSKTLDPNKYATKKTIAQGMLDVALLTANASQLKYVLTVGEAHAFYTLMLTLISVSLVLQGLTGVLIPVLAALNINIRERQTPAEHINHFVLGLNLLILAVDGIKMGFDGGFQPKQNETSLIP